MASRLEGTWQTHGSLTQRLTRSTSSRSNQVSFRSDPTVAGMVPDRQVGFFSERNMKVYLAGYVDLLEVNGLSTCDQSQQRLADCYKSLLPDVLARRLEGAGHLFGRFEDVHSESAIGSGIIFGDQDQNGRVDRSSFP